VAEERREPASKNYDGTTGAYRATCVALYSSQQCSMSSSTTVASGARRHAQARNATSIGIISN
jgi:hypothetical protein